jgi:hypothetical protein
MSSTPNLTLVAANPPATDWKALWRRVYRNTTRGSLALHADGWMARDNMRGRRDHMQKVVRGLMVAVECGAPREDVMAPLLEAMRLIEARYDAEPVDVREAIVRETEAESEANPRQVRLMRRVSCPVTLEETEQALVNHRTKIDDCIRAVRLKLVSTREKARSAWQNRPAMERRALQMTWDDNHGGAA